MRNTLPSASAPSATTGATERAAWYGRGSTLIAAVVLALLGLVLVVVGASNLVGASNARDDADNLEAQAREAAAEAEATSNAAAKLPDVSNELDTRLNVLVDAADRSTVLFNAWDSCAFASTTVDQFLAACSTQADAFAAAVRAEIEAIKPLRLVVRDALATVQEASRG